MRHQVNILIVDSREMQASMEPMIRRELHPDSVTLCETPEEAVAAVEARTKYALIFADWEIAGECFVRAVRESSHNRYAPVIVMASADNNEMIGQVMRSGATDLLVKPFLEKGLVAKIRRVTQTIDRRRQQRFAMPEQLSVSAQIEDQKSGGRAASMAMLDISSGGCKVKVPLSCNTRIYDKANLQFTFRDSDFEIVGYLIRLEADPELATSGGEHMFASFVFSKMSDAVRENLNQMLDELSEYELRY